jgi:hypothetical protein
MKALFCLFAALICSTFSPGLEAEENFPIVSANGFSCSQNDGMVSCRGSFPGHPAPALEATGYNVVWIRGEFPEMRYTFYSDSGCLCRTDFKPDGQVKTQECTSRFGQMKAFKGGKSTYDWCRKK